MPVNKRIHALPLHLANQIAAGEVIERPASVVKELVENSLDAGATQITIDIEGAGSHLIRIRDNGFGIHQDDLPLALSRHATSKLHSSEQLSHISSLGFRGEALPSITSISQLTITSRQTDSEYGWQINGLNNAISPASHPEGTTIEVRDLFFNLPARRHFLRSNKTEQHHILTTLQRLALSQFEVGFNCKLSDNQQLKLPSAKTEIQRQQRLAKVCGKQFIEHSIFLQQDYNDVSLQGWIIKTEAHRAQTDVQHFFINGRVIRDKVINHAIRQAYGDSIPAGRQTAYVLYLTLPLDRVDINVHPTKHEVRFRDARLIHGLITTALQEALSQSSHDERIESEPKSHQTKQAEIVLNIAEQAQNYPTENIDTKTTLTPSSFGPIISLLHQRYAITQSEQGTILLDLQHAERQLRRLQLLQAIKTKTLRSRPILVPIKLQLESELITIAQHKSELLESFGIELQTTPEYLIIKRIPSLFAQVEIKQFISDILASLANNGNKNQLEQFLLEYLPLISINNLEHAKQLVIQLNELPIQTDWCTPLDQQHLNRLFSKPD